MNDLDTLTKDNWREACLEAIAELPDDITASVGHYQPSDDCLVIRVACEPWEDDESETHVNEIKVRWWDTYRKELEARIRESPGRGFEEDLDFQSQRAGIDLPTISIKPGGASGPTTGLYAGREGACVAEMKGEIQVAILNELFEGEGQSMVFKNRKGRFVREDGTHILDW